jgi:hypothetical protein
MSIHHAVRKLAIGLCLLAVGACTTGPSMAAVQPTAPQVTPGNARVWFIRQYEPYESLARPMIYANGTPVAPSEPGGAFYRDFSPGGYTFTVDSYGEDFNQATTLQLTSGTQTYLEIQSLHSWASGGGENGAGRDTFYVRIPSPYFLTKYYLPQLTYLGAR